MGQVNDWMSQSQAVSSEGSRPQAGSKPPLNLHRLEQASDWKDTIDVWASELLTLANPGMRYQPGNWRLAQSIFQQLAHKAVHYPNAGMMIDEILHALHQLTRIQDKPEPRTLTTEERDEARQNIGDSALLIRDACEVVRMITGVELKPERVRQWKHRGRIESIGEPPRYIISDLLALSHPIGV